MLLTMLQREKFNAVDLKPDKYDEYNDAQQDFDRPCIQWLVQSIGLFWNNPLILEGFDFARISKINLFECFPIIYTLFENWESGTSTGGFQRWFIWNSTTTKQFYQSGFPIDHTHLRTDRLCGTSTLNEEQRDGIRSGELLNRNLLIE